MKINKSEYSSSDNPDKIKKVNNKQGSDFSGSFFFSRLSGKTIAVDLTPLLPGGKNGGAKLVALELIREMARILPDTTFLLLTSDLNHFELGEIDSLYFNVKRECVLQKTAILNFQETQKYTIVTKYVDNLKAFARQVLSSSMKEKIKHLFFAQNYSPNNSGMLYQMGVDLLFCPFTVPIYADIRIPTVSILHDLQFRTYPQFFSDIELVQREEGFALTCQKADHIITISEYVKKTILDGSNLLPKDISVIKHGLLLETVDHCDDQLPGYLLDKHNLTEGEYLIYPANFWKHKNHSMLLTSFGIFRKSHPDSNLKLVCTGEPDKLSEKFLSTARKMGLSDWVVYPGYVSLNEYTYLLERAYALIFPSLYEGFGLPVLEAMAKGIPVLCSNISSLPEVGGDAVLYFDPRIPDDICHAIERLNNEKGLRKQLIEKGKQQALSFGGFERMAKEYLMNFSNVMDMPCKDGVSGIYEDHWTSNQVYIRFSPSPADSKRRLSIQLINPDWRDKEVKITTEYKENELIAPTHLEPGEEIDLEFPLPDAGGIINFMISPTFIPEELGIGKDNRELGLSCTRCEIVELEKTVNLFEKD